MTCRSLGGGLIERYRDRLPISNDTRIISLSEGSTPLLRLDNIATILDRDITLYAKYEGLNPTGSFKDRGMTVAVTKAVEEGSKAIICASTGNTSASAAAYAAQAGITAFVLIPDGKIAQGKLAQAMMAGAVIIQIKGNFDDGMSLVKKVADELPVTVVNSINPYRLQGQKTAAFEIVEALGRAPDFHCLPVGNAGNISAYWIGYSEYAADKDEYLADPFGMLAEQRYAGSSFPSDRPKMVGYQASGAAPFLSGAMVENPETVATAIRIGNPQSWEYAWIANKESGGWFNKCDDQDILAAQKMLAEKEGVFCEPASAASLAGAMSDINVGKIPPGSVIVCTLTGHGMKDPDIAIAQNTAPVIKAETNMSQIKRAILDHM